MKGFTTFNGGDSACISCWTQRNVLTTAIDSRFIILKFLYTLKFQIPLLHFHNKRVKSYAMGDAGLTIGWNVVKFDHRHLFYGYLCRVLCPSQRNFYSFTDIYNRKLQSLQADNKKTKNTLSKFLQFTNQSNTIFNMEIIMSTRLLQQFHFCVY